ncbi:MAG: RpiB/LacA/LacB family sugar-phosphate isomerase [Solirubrobacteraceae bacterium]
MRVAVGFDHAGVPLRDTVIEAVRAAGHEPVDAGNRDDYPDTAADVARAVLTSCDRGIMVCGSGAGVAVAACKIEGIRASMGHDTYTAAQCVLHDDCNVLALGARVIGPKIAEACTWAFLAAAFTGEERHVRRVGKIARLEREGLPPQDDPKEI